MRRNNPRLVKRLKETEQWLEWALNRLDHILIIHAIPTSVEAGFGMFETLVALVNELPKAEQKFPFYEFSLRDRYTHHNLPYPLEFKRVPKIRRRTKVGASRPVRTASGT
jgi:hypothetical protein